MLVLLTQDEPRAKLATTVTVEWRAAELGTAVRETLVKAGLVLSEDEITRNAMAGKTATLALRDVSARTVLKQLLGVHGLTLIHADGALVVRTTVEAFPVETRVYDIRDLRAAVEDFPGPKVELKASGVGAVFG